LAVTPTAAPNEFKMTSPLGKEFFLAIKSGGKIAVGWPVEKDEKTGSSGKLVSGMGIL
jgi:hypothetical protein